MVSRSPQQKSQPKFDVGTETFREGKIELENRLKRGFSTASTQS
jgi:hypothetical protein